MGTRWRDRRAAATLAGLLLMLGGAAVPTGAASPQPAVSMGLTGDAPLQATSERVVKPGWVVDTFSDSKTTVRAFGRSSSTVTFGQAITPGKSGSASFSITSPDTKGAGRWGGQAAPGAVEALIALGVDPKVALEQFGDMDTADGSTPASDVALAMAAMQGVAQPSSAGTSVSRATLASTTRVQAPRTLTANATSSTSVPYDTQCATIDQVNHLVQGYGC